MPKSYKTVEIEQQVRFGFTSEFVEKALREWSVVKDYAYILHDKDTKENGEVKEPHIHLMIRFNDSVPTTAILSRFHNAVVIDGKTYVTVAENNLQKCHKWTSAIAYLTHSNRLDKYQYSDDEVKSNYNWVADKETALNPIKDERLNAIITAIDSEKMRRYNYNDFVTAQEYVKYKRQIDDAFKYVNDRNISKGMVKDMRVMFITGASGTGKTTYAKNFCDEHNLSFYVSSGSNDVLDGYGGQDVIILDDLRPSCMGLSDLLKLLDNNTSSTIKSRYINKSISYCRYIVITTVLDIDTFFSNVFQEEKEPIVQLKRRCGTYMKFDDTHITTYLYNDDKRDYVKICTLPNTFSAKYRKESMSEEKLKDMVEDLFKGIVKVTDDMIKSEPTFESEFMEVDDDVDALFK